MGTQTRTTDVTAIALCTSCSRAKQQISVYIKNEVANAAMSDTMATDTDRELAPLTCEQRSGISLLNRWDAPFRIFASSSPH